MLGAVLAAFWFALEALVYPRYLSLVERERIHDLGNSGESVRAIGRTIGRSPSTVSRELTRNTTTTVGYPP